jgi:hypothetical protein
VKQHPPFSLEQPTAFDFFPNFNTPTTTKPNHSKPPIQSNIHPNNHLNSNIFSTLNSPKQPADLPTPPTIHNNTHKQHTRSTAYNHHPAPTKQPISPQLSKHTSKSMFAQLNFI